MAVRGHKKVQVRDLKWTEFPRCQPSPLPPEKHCGRKKQSNKAKDEGDTEKHESQVLPCGGQQAENSFFKKSKNVEEHFKGMKHITRDESESPRSQLSPLPPEKHCGKKKQSNKAKDEGDTEKHESQVLPCGGQQAENSFFKKLKNVKEHFKGMKVRVLDSWSRKSRSKYSGFWGFYRRRRLSLCFELWAIPATV
ncbi:hypothetical protein KOW79_016899 [Hemibagrus wyckioides]|uniref:Uncharacterized protein n=1 Tax=Hemibagrus wyckioides TaxID=337641 RepID=A0A9D3NBK7_9TELE|nr:hypothetical protein KOW79_016899 [Hemibagrus wyckioides]